MGGVCRRKRRQAVLLLSVVIAAVLFSGCGKTVRTDITKLNVGTAEAEKILGKTELCVITLIQSADEKLESDTLKKAFTCSYGEEQGMELLRSLVIEDEKTGQLKINRKSFYPTIYHQDIAVTKAYLQKKVHRDFGKVISTEEHLVIVEGYIGEEKSAKSFERLNFYRQDEDGNWVYDHMEGTSCYYYEDMVKHKWG